MRQRRDAERQRLAAPGLRDAHNVPARGDDGPAQALDGGGALEAGAGGQAAGVEAGVGEGQHGPGKRNKTD